MASIFVVEDHQLLSGALRRILRERGGFDVVGMVPTAEQALEDLDGLKVDLVLVDVSLPGMNGIDLVAALQNRRKGLPCLMLSGHSSRQYVERSMEVGARGYVLKDDIAGILEGIRRVLAGGTYISKQLQ
ncbi:MAG TPA: response regulator transcription factor [Anaerolineales bacterium]